MEFKLKINGDKQAATIKANALVTLAKYLDAETLKAFAKVVKTDPQKVALAKGFLGIG